MTIKIENGKYYAVFNIENEIPEFPKTKQFVGIDLGMRTLATLDNGLKIANLDVTYEENMIKKYQKRLSRKKHNSNRYKKTLKTYWKWIDKKRKNKRLLPQNNHKNRRKIRHNHTRRPKHKRNVSKSSLQSKITKNSMEKICRNAQIQSRNIRKNTKTNNRWHPSTKHAATVDTTTKT